MEFFAADWINNVRVVITSSMSFGDFNFILRLVLFSSSSLNLFHSLD